MLNQLTSDLDRRSFLRNAGIAGTALATGAAWPSSAQTQGADTSLLVHTTSPMNAEPHLNDLVKSWITPIESFYIRSHAPNPKIDPDSFRLSVEGLVDRPLSISLSELASEFESTSVVATMTCAGNRRTEHSLIKPIKGVPWQAGAIGNARWAGVRLSAALKKAGLQDGAKHVWFEGLDEIPKSGQTIAFGGSIPVSKALADTDSMPGALVTTGMNGQPLTPDHGAPLRMVVPGYIGARSVKWLGKIVVSDRPSPNHYVATAYKLVQDGEPLEWDEQGPIYRFPLNSVICNPEPNDKLSSSSVKVAGYALPQGRPGTTVSRVEVSADGGRSWTTAKISSPVREFCWVLWSANVNVSDSTSELIVRASDSRGKSQPQIPEWNMKGYLFNAWHHVPISAS